MTDPVPSKERFDYRVEGTRILWDFPGGIGERAATFPELYLWSQIESLARDCNDKDITIERLREDLQRTESAHAVVMAENAHYKQLATGLRRELAKTLTLAELAEAFGRAAQMAHPSPDPLPELNWMPFEAGVEFLSQRLMTASADWLPNHWECKYLDVRVDMRTGAMLIRPGNTPPPGDGWDANGSPA